MRFLIISLLLCLAATPGIAQDSITPNTTKNQVNSTLATGPGKIFTYAKFIARGEPNTASAESVESALNRLFTAIGARQEILITDGTTAPTDSDKILGQKQIYIYEDSYTVPGTTTPSVNRLLFYHNGVTADAWTALDMPPQHYFSYRAPHTHLAYNSYLQHGSNTWWLVTQYGNTSPRSGRVFLQNGAGATLSDGTLIQNGDELTRPGLHPGTLLRAIGSITYTDDDGNQQTRTTSDTVTCWRIVAQMLERRTLASVDIQYSPDQALWTFDKNASDAWWRFRVGGNASTYSPALPLPATVTATDIEGLDARIEHLIELEGLTESQIPLWGKPERQILRIGTAYTLDMSEYVDAATSYTASELPNGINMNTAGVISGTPTHEGEWFPIITATNVFDSATISFPMLVLRQESFATGQLQRLEGLTVNTAGKIVAIDESGGGSLRLFPHKGTPEAQADGLIPTAEATAVTLQPGSGVTAGYAGIAFDNTNYVTLADPATVNSQTVYSFVKFNPTTGAQVGNVVANARLAGARSLTDDGTRIWAVVHALGSTYVDAFTRDTLTFANMQHQLATSLIDAQGLVVKDTRFFIVDNSTNTVKAYSSTGTRGANETHRDFTLTTANNRPRGLTYHENYFYILNEGAEAVNDTIFIYPDKGTWDATVPDLTLLEFVTRGPFIENNIIRVRATFTAPVDITADVKLRLDIGGQEREALSVASATAPVTAAPQTNTRTAYFAYTVQAASADIDADGVETYQFPFKGGTGDGTIYPHTAWDRIDSHNLIGNNSRFRVTQPGGLRTLLPRTHQRVNSSHQADWGEKDPDSPNFVARKPEFFPINPKDQGSLDHWNWVKSTSTSIEFLAEQQATDANGILNTIEQDNGWETEHQTQPVPATEFLYIRWTAADTTRLAETFIQGTVPWYDKSLSTIPNSDKWVTYNGGQAYNGHYYYGLKQAAGTTGTVFAATRQLPYTALTGTPTIPPAQVQVDWESTTPGDPRTIINKPALPLIERGEETNTVSLLTSEVHTLRITIPDDIRTYATRYNQPIDVRIDTRWRRNPAAPATASMEIKAKDAGGQDFNPELIKRFDTLPTTYTNAEYAFELPSSATVVQVLFERNDDGASTVDISHRRWLLEFGSAEIAENAITADKIADDAVTLPKLAVLGTPHESTAIGWTEGQWAWIPTWEMLETVTDTGAQVAIATGIPTLAQAALLPFRGETLTDPSVRNGRIIVFKLSTTYDVNDYFAHIAHPEDTRYQAVENLLVVADMTRIGEQGGYSYYRSAGTTIIANEAVYACKIDDYRAKLTAKVVQAEQGTPSDITNVTGTTPITVTGTTTKNVSISNNAIAPEFLKADTDTEKAAMRQRIEAAVDTGLDKPFTIAQYTESASEATTHYNTQFTFSTDFPDLVNAANGRPYEVSLAMTVQGTPNSGNIDVGIEIRGVGNSGVLDTVQVTSTAGASVQGFLSASLPGGTTEFWVRTFRRTGTVGYQASAVGSVQVVPQQQISEQNIAWAPSRLGNDGDAFTAMTFTKSGAYRVGKLLYVSTTIALTHGTNLSYRTFHVRPPTGFRYKVSLSQGFTFNTSRNTLGMAQLYYSSATDVWFEINTRNVSQTTGTFWVNGVLLLE